MCADTVTANYHWIKPEIAGSPTTWGVKLNADLDDIDAKVAASAAGIAGISGVVPTSNEIVLNTPTKPAVNTIYGYAAGAARWGVFLGDGEAETGGNVGSNFLIQAYSDAGGFLNNALEIRRSSGEVIAAGPMSVAGPISAAYFVVNGTLTSLFGNYLQLASGVTIQWTGGSIGFNGPSGELAEMDDGGAFGITGQGYKPGGGSWADSSDARIKTVERPYKLGLDEILKLDPVVYHFNANDAEPGKPSKKLGVKGKPFVGLVAQDVEAVFPGMVTKRVGYVDGAKVEDLRDLDASEIVYALINAVKSLAARVAELEAR